MQAANEIRVLCAKIFIARGWIKVSPMDEARNKTITQFDHRFAILSLQFGRFPYKFLTSLSR